MAERMLESSDEEPDDSDSLPGSLVRKLESLGLRGTRMHERAEQLHALYKLMKVLGFSDADIARLVMRNAIDKVDEGLERVHPTDARPVFDLVENSFVRAAEQVDTRLGLGGNLLRRVWDGAAAVRAGREEALIGLERGIGQSREQFRRILEAVSATAGDETETDEEPAFVPNLDDDDDEAL